MQRMSAPACAPGGLPRKTHAGLQAGARIIREYAPTRLPPALSNQGGFVHPENLNPNKGLTGMLDIRAGEV